MIVHQVFAQIFDGEIKNIIVCDDYEMANWLARGSYGDEAFAVDCLQYPCAKGDRYHNGIFYRLNENGDETEINYVPTVEQQVPMLSAQVSYISMMTNTDIEGV